MYPRKYKALGEKHISPTHGVGTVLVVKFDAFREPGSKQKFWTYTVSYANNDGTTVEEKVTVPAKETAIVMFPERSDLPDMFLLAPFRKDHAITTGDQRESLNTIFRKLDLTKTHAQDVEWWEQYFQSQPNDPSSVTTTKPFQIPKRNLNALSHASNMKGTLPIDDGIRDVDVVTHREFNPSCRRNALRKAEAEVLAGLRMDKLSQGMFVVLDFGPKHSDWYPWSFLIAEINQNIAHLDTTVQNTSFEVQIYRPCGNVAFFQQTEHTKLLRKGLVKWQGSDNQFWKPTILRSDVKAIIEVSRVGKKLSSKSINLILSMYFPNKI